MKPQTMIDIVRNWGSLTKALNGINKSVEEAAKSRFQPPDKKETLRHLVHQLEKETVGFTFYFLTAKDLKIKEDKRQGPLITVALAQVRRKAKNSFDFARGIGVCYPKDTPNKIDGKVAAAKHLLKALHHGKSTVNPNSSGVEEILEKLYAKKMVDIADGGLDYVVGDRDITLTAKEARIAASFVRKPETEETKFIVQRFAVAETFETRTREDALKIIDGWKSREAGVRCELRRIK